MKKEMIAENLWQMLANHTARLKEFTKPNIHNRYALYLYMTNGQIQIENACVPSDSEQLGRS